MAERPQRTCKCGHTRSHDMVVEEPEYTLWGWILLSMFGVTPKPDHVVYRCQLCRQSLGSTRDPRVLARRGGAPPPRSKDEARERSAAPPKAESTPDEGHAPVRREDAEGNAET